MSYLTKEELKYLAQERGRELAVLLHISKMPLEIKKAWITLLPQMSLSQIEKLILFLEEGLSGQITKEVDEVFMEKILKMLNEFVQEREKIDRNFLKKIKQLRKDINNKL